MSHRLVPATLVVVVVATALAACGSGSSGTSASTSTSAPSGYGAAPAKTTAAAPAAGAAATIGTASNGKLGTILVDGTGRTVYLWEADTGTVSTCTGACAGEWPPVLTKGAPTATGKAVSADLGTTKRSDGTTQVTYKGHPLYLFADDSAPGQANGQGSDGFGAEWYVLAPSGTKVDDS